MKLYVGQSQSLKATLLDEYEGGYFKACSAPEKRFLTSDVSLAAVEGESVFAVAPGAATITAEVNYGDGVGWRQVEGSIPVEIQALPTVTVPGETVLVQPAIIKPKLIDIS
ncbi:MAG TPA: hypothetical protein PLN21_09270 [Gemmatales bacterium]|nr:hypothetical protein [Gemmatales bacterium]